MLPVAALAACNCSRISSVVQERSSPIVPVAQNVQPCRQPTWDDTQSVEKPRRYDHSLHLVATWQAEQQLARAANQRPRWQAARRAGGEKCAWSAALVLRPSPLPSSNGSRPPSGSARPVSIGPSRRGGHQPRLATRKQWRQESRCW